MEANAQYSTSCFLHEDSKASLWLAGGLQPRPSSGVVARSMGSRNVGHGNKRHAPSSAVARYELNDFTEPRSLRKGLHKHKTTLAYRFTS